MNIALIGPTGSGKGTHALELEERFSMRHAATGDLLRENLKQQTPLGLLAQSCIERGELVPDELVDAMIQSWIRATDDRRGILFDGFPRTAYQASFMDELLGKLGRSLDLVVYLRVSDEAIIERLSGRTICHLCQATYHDSLHPPTHPGKCDRCQGELIRRPDDTPEIVAARLRSFHRTTGPVLDYYQKSHRLVILEGEGSVRQVKAALLATLDHVSRGEVPASLLANPQDVTDLKPVPPETALSARPSLDLVLLGGPGSGKGTQAEQLCRALGLPHIATGDLFRENLKHQTDLGKLAKTYMDRGELVPDDVTEAMVRERLARPDTQAGFVLDGFPRTLPQAQALAEIMGHLRRRLEGVLYIDVSDGEIVNRLSGRLICRHCQTPYHRQFKPPKAANTCDACGGELYQRDDDNPTTVKARLATFLGQTTPLIRFYKESGLLHEIQGEGKPAEVTERTLAVARNLAGS